MKKRVLSILCAAAMLLPLSATPALAQDEYKVFAEADFDSKVSLGTLDLNSDKIAEEAGGNKYLTASGFYSLDYARKNVIIDLRARYDGSGFNFGAITTRDGGSGETWSRTTNVRFSNTDWKYYRVVYDFENYNIAVYRSDSGKGDWQPFSATTAFGKDSSNAQASGIAMIKFERLQVDDIMIYQNGTAPTATVSVTKSGKLFSADYTYSDAENDEEAGIKYQWQISEDGVSFDDISGAAENMYTAASEQSGKYIRCAVTPLSTRYPEEGAKAYSEAVLYKEYACLIEQDFESADIAPFSGNTETDEVNTSKYLAPAGNQFDLSNLSIPTDETVIELRAKVRETSANKGENWFIITFIGDKYWDNQTQYAVDNGADSWRYYRFVFEGKENPAFKAYTSTDRKSWKEAGREVGYATTSYKNEKGTMKGIYQIRFGSCYIDDFKVYRCGTAPTGTNARLVRSGDVLSADFAYSDAEGDSQGTAKYQWQRSEDGTEFEDIDGADDAQYELCNADRGKIVRAIITPVSCEYPTDGEQIQTEPISAESFAASRFGEIEYSISDGMLTAAVGFIRTIGEESAVITAAVYDKSGALKQLMRSDKINITDMQSISREFDISAVDAEDEIRLMLWRDVKTLAPLANIKTVER